MAGNETNDKTGDKKREKEECPLSPAKTPPHNNILLFTMVKKRTSLHRVVFSFIMASLIL